MLSLPVPCLSRASDLERYDPKTEFALDGDDDGWTATHKDPTSDKRAGEQQDADLPSIDGPSGTAGGTGDAAGSDDDIPDISELELQDEVGHSRGLTRTDQSYHTALVCWVAQGCCDISSKTAAPLCFTNTPLPDSAAFVQSQLKSEFLCV